MNKLWMLPNRFKQFVCNPSQQIGPIEEYKFIGASQSQKGSASLKFQVDYKLELWCR
jgi:hypothetical protein